MWHLVEVQEDQRILWIISKEHVNLRGLMDPGSMSCVNQLTVLFRSCSGLLHKKVHSCFCFCSSTCTSRTHNLLHAFCQWHRWFSILKNGIRRADTKEAFGNLHFHCLFTWKWNTWPRLSSSTPSPSWKPILKMKQWGKLMRDDLLSPSLFLQEAYKDCSPPFPLHSTGRVS